MGWERERVVGSEWSLGGKSSRGQRGEEESTWLLRRLESE